MRRLIVLATGSEHDIGILKKKPLPRGDIRYIESDRGLIVDTLPPPSSERVLCLVTLNRFTSDDARATNTSRILRAIERAERCNSVVGLHIQGDCPDSYVCVDKNGPLPNGVRPTAYSTNRPEFRFVEGYCEELLKDEPGVNRIHAAFDRLFQQLGSSISRPLTASQRVENIEHQIIGLCGPVADLMQLWREEGFDDAFWPEVLRERELPLNQLISEVQGGVHGRPRAFFQRDSIRLILGGRPYAGDPPLHLGCWKRLIELVPPDNGQSQSGLFERVETNLRNLHESGNLKLVRDDVEGQNSFGAWLNALQKELHALVDVTARAEGGE